MLRSTNGENDQTSSGSTARPYSPEIDGDGKKKRQGQILVVQHGRQREHRPAQKRGERPQQDAKNDDGFETDVRRIEVGHDEANPHAQRQRDAEEGQQSEGLTGGAPLGEQQTLKGKRPGSHRRHRRGHAQLDQQ